MFTNIHANTLVKWQPYGMFVYMSVQEISPFKVLQLLSFHKSVSSL